MHRIASFGFREMLNCAWVGAINILQAAEDRQYCLCPTCSRLRRSVSAATMTARRRTRARTRSTTMSRGGHRQRRLRKLPYHLLKASDEGYLANLNLFPRRVFTETVLIQDQFRPLLAFLFILKGKRSFFWNFDLNSSASCSACSLSVKLCYL